jgi:uncharacterized protein
MAGDLYSSSMAEITYALITGASSGIGECFARALAARRRNLILVARSEDRLQALATELRDRHNILAEPVAADLALPGAAAALVARLEERRLAVDLLVNNAGFGAQGEFARLPLARQSEMLAVNVQALIELTHFLVRPMIERRQGGVINVGSTASFQPVPYITAYAATKAFVSSFSQALAEELRPYGVVVVTLCPGGTRTNFLKVAGYTRPKLLGTLQAPEDVVEAGLNTLDRGGGLVVPRWVNKLTVFVQRFMPRRLPIRMAGEIFKPPGRSE